MVGGGLTVTESLFSPLWYRVAELHLRLRSHVRMRRHSYRDQVWYLLVDDASGRQHRVNAQAYQFIGRMDGTRTVQALWDILLEELGDDAPAQDDILRMLAQLGACELIQCEAMPDMRALFQQSTERARRRRLNWVNPLAFHVHLGDPGALLDRVERFAFIGRWLFHPLAAASWLVLVAGAGLAALVHLDALHAQAAGALTSPRHLLLAWLCFPFIKALHELGHALALRHWGGEIHEAGVAMLVLTPAPYVDVSGASAFRDRWRRFAVGAAGMVVELALAAVALFLWLNIESGFARDLAFVIVLTGAVSTLLFNANPLLRLDGYYMWCDAMDLPNLATRSRAYWGLLVRRVVLSRSEAAGEIDAMQIGAGEKKWLLLYAPASLACRVILACLIVLWLGSISALLGWAAALGFAVFMAAKPLTGAVRSLFAASPLGRVRRRARFAVAGIAVTAVIVLGVLPLPFVTVAEGIVWLPEQARVRAGTEGFVTRVLARDGARVEAGQVLLELQDSLLPLEKDKLSARLAALQSEQYGALLRNPSRAQDLAEEMTRTQAQITRVEERMAKLQVRSNVAGRLVMPRQQDLPGAFAREGAMVGYVLSDAAIEVRAAIAQEDAAISRGDARRIEVRFAERPDVAIAATLQRAAPAATTLLPSAALGNRSGGEHPTDPSDKEGLRSREAVFVFDIAVPGSRLERVGGRVWVRFDHGTAPLANQWFRRASQLFLKHFDPATPR